MCAHICVCTQRSEDTFSFDTKSAVCLLHGIPEILPSLHPITPTGAGITHAHAPQWAFLCSQGSEPGSSHLPNKHFYPQAVIISYYFLILLK